jgi:hypothetical protein
MISDTAPTNVVLPTPNPPEMTIFVADERSREDPVSDERSREDPVSDERSREDPVSAVSRRVTPSVEPGGLS